MKKIILYSIENRDKSNYYVFTTPASITGLPAISVPAGKVYGKDIGLQIMAPHFCEKLIFKLAEDFWID